ncbi:hypothetical protein FJZ31_32975 [Candidatus Poribacteria bacterium]|nr:hypothetical protein [Candidatus Poribacteria bacterium]
MNKLRFFLIGFIISIFIGFITIATLPQSSSSTEKEQQARDTRPDGSRIEQYKAPEDDLYKSPIQMVISQDGQRLYVVCEKANALQVVDTEHKKVVTEIPVGRNPYGVAISPDERYLYVSNRWDDTVSVVDAETFKVLRTIPVDGDPHGIVTDKEGKILYVVNLYHNTIALVSLETFKEIKRLSAGNQPFEVAISPDGQYVYVSNQLTNPVPFRTTPISEVTIIDTRKQIVVDRRMLLSTDISQGIACSPDGKLVFVALELPKNLLPETQIYQGWMVTYGLAILEAKPRGRVAFLLLDEMNLYYADPFEIVFTPDSRYAYVSSSGVDAVSVVNMEKVKELLEIKDGKILASEEKLKRYARHLALSEQYVVQRIPTEYNPKGMVASKDGQFIYITNRLSDSITIVETDRQEVVGTIDLGGPKKMTLLRWGEYLFNHSAISFQKQLSCNTCHPENHVDALIYDIAVDGGMGGNLVDNRTMRGIAYTAPFKWSGKNPTIARQEGPRAAQLFFRSHGFEEKDRDAVVAFIESLPLPPNRHNNNPALIPSQQRGKAIFERAYTNDGRYIPIANRCITCHPAPYYTDRKTHDVGTRAYFDTSGAFDTPQLNNLHESAPYLHDGRCWSIEEIWTIHGTEDLHGVVNDLTKQQLIDLIEYLKTL